MNEFIHFLLQFAHLNEQQINLISKKGRETILPKEEYFVEAGKVFRQVGFIIEGIIRICYYNNKGEEITKIFIEENHLLINLNNAPSTEYIQAATDCRMLVLSNEDWKEIAGWEDITQKIQMKSLNEKLTRVTPLVAQDAQTRYLEFMDKYPTLANRIPLSYIASYLGITQSTLSRIRKKIC